MFFSKKNLLVGKIENSPFAILKGTPGKLKLAWKSSPKRSTTRWHEFQFPMPLRDFKIYM